MHEKRRLILVLYLNSNVITENSNYISSWDKIIVLQSME